MKEKTNMRRVKDVAGFKSKQRVLNMMDITLNLHVSVTK